MNEIGRGASFHFVMMRLFIGSLALNGCAGGGVNGIAPAGSVATTISSVSHYGSGIGIPEFYVNGAWGGNQGGWGGGGGTVCCVTMPYRSGEETTVTVKWKTYRSMVNEERWHEATVPVNFEVPPGKGSGIQVHFLPGHRVEVWYSLTVAWAGTYPGPKYPHDPAPTYVPLAEEKPAHYVPLANETPYLEMTKR